MGNNKYLRKEGHIKETNTDLRKTPNVSQPTKGALSTPTFLMSHQTLPCTNLNPFPSQSRCSARHPRASQRRSSTDLQIGTNKVLSVSRYQPLTSLKSTTPWMTSFLAAWSLTSWRRSRKWELRWLKKRGCQENKTLQESDNNNNRDHIGKLVTIPTC